MSSSRSAMLKNVVGWVLLLSVVGRFSGPLYAGESQPCVGDCNGDGQVTVDEIVLGVSIALGTTDLGECPAFDPSGDGRITVDELVQGSDNALNGCPQPSPTATPPEPSPTEALPTETPTPEPPTPTPTEPLLGGSECSADTCVHDHTQVVAIGHSNKDAGKILYRVTVQDRDGKELSTGTDWGDGVNGFFYRVTAEGEVLTVVPFNGVGIGRDNRPTLRRFSFIVPAATDAPSLTIEACATNYQGTDMTTPCTQMLWSDEHDPLPQPDTSGPPWGNASLEFVSTDAVVVVNNGVYGGHVKFKVVDLDMSDVDLTIPENAEWFAKHLVFIDDNLDVYTNNLFSETVAALPLDQAAFATSPGGSSFRTKYGAKDPVDNEPATPSYFLYVRSSSTQQFGVAAKFLYDTEGSTGTLGGRPGFGGLLPPAGSGAGSQSCSETPCKTITPEDPTTSVSVLPEAEAGEKETRLICLTPGGSCYQDVAGTCIAASNPLAVNTSTAFNLPDYVIDRSIPSGTWQRQFGAALYYVVSAGFGNCDQGSLPFCDQQVGYVGYVPHYTDLNRNTGPLNGGSTTDPLVGALTLADRYALPALSNSTANRLVWFDNCGGGHFYVECAQGSPACKRLPLPALPNNGTAVNYAVTNGLPNAVVFAKECCASFYQLNDTTRDLERPQQIDDSFGIFVGAKRPGASAPGFDFGTLFNDEAMVVYDAATGDQLYKLRLQPSGAHLYSCADPTCIGATQGDGCPSLSFTSASGSNPNALTLAGAGEGSIVCAPVGDCPFGTSKGFDGQLTTCTAKTSQFILGVRDWADEVSGRTSSGTVQLRAWGSAGKGGGKDGGCSGGSAGASGFASTSRTFSDLADNLYVLAGSHGVSTILSTDPLSSVKDPNTADPATFAYLIAGGGGTGGDGNENDSDCRGGNGGAGGVAIAKNSNPISNQFGCGNGAAGDRSDATGGEGCSNGKGGAKGGEGEKDGETGIGGYSSGTKWNTGSLIPPDSWSAGNGAGASNGAGPGGGGYGGGGGGGKATVGGGAGGGSWAAAITAYDPFYPQHIGSPNGSNGAAQLAYLTGYMPVLYRYNAGAVDVNATDGGPHWDSDDFILDGGGQDTDVSSHSINLNHHTLASAACPSSVIDNCLGGAPEFVFQEQRVDPSGGFEMAYAIPVASGDELEVRLLLAETDPSITKPGQRVFSVKVEGSVPSEFKNIDQIALSGAQYRGSMVVYRLTMSDDTLNLEFEHGVGNPAIKGIEIRVNARNIASRGLLTSTGHPYPTECLSTSGAGVLLTNQSHALVWQEDGDLVLVDSRGRAIWRSETSGIGAQVCFRSGGNLLIEDANNTIVFNTNTADGQHGGSGGTRLVLNDSCNLTISHLNGAPIFQTSTTCSSTPLPTYTPTPTFTRTPTQTRVPSATLAPTRTATASRTASATRTVTPTRTITHTRTITPTHTASPTSTPTASVTPTSTLEPSSTPTDTPTVTKTPAPTETPSVSPTSTATPRTVEVLTNQLTSTNHPSPTDCLQLPGDDGVVLDNGVAQLIWKTDGNLVLQQGTTVLFQANTSDDELGGNGGRRLCFPNSLIVYDESAAELFSTETDDGHLMRLEASCNLVIASLSGTVLFETSTQCQ